MALTGTGGAHYLHLRCFLEGIEVPVIGASVTSQLNAPATANIQIVPSDRLATLLPRTTVHLFFLDSVTFAGRGEGAEPDDHDYRLMFCGEVFDTSIGKSGHGSRSASLRCMDFSNVWDTNYSYIMRYAVGAQETAEGGAILKNVSGFVGGGGTNNGSGNSNPFDDIVNSPADVIARMATASGAGNPAAPGKGTVLGGLLAVLELLSGIQGLYIGINPWATVHERRCRVMDSLVSDNGTTAKSLFDQQVFADWLQQRTGTAASVISFRQIINLILGYIYYDVVTNVTPSYFAGDNGAGLPGRDVPEWKVSAGGPAEEGGESDALSLSELTNMGPVPRGKVAGLDSTFWAYCTEVLTKLSELCATQKFKSGSMAGKPIRFAITSGYRNMEQQQALNDKKAADGKGKKATRRAHTAGFAIDIAAIGIGATGTMPYMKGEKGSTMGKPIPIEVAAGPKTNATKRFRAALFALEMQQGPIINASITDFDDLLKKIRAHENTLSKCFVNEAGLAVAEATVRNAAQFWKLYGEAVKAVNKTTKTGIRGWWGGDWKTATDPLWGMFGVGLDPVHVEDEDWDGKTASTLGGFAPPTEVSAVLRKGESRETLKSFIFRPNIWFCAPPLCNVVLPHMYETMSVSRQMMRETTRLQLDAFNQFFESNVLNTFYYAPQFQAAEGKTSANHVMGEGMGSVTKTIVMDHEVFSGIIPKMERISEISFYAKQSGQGSELRVTDSGEVEASSAQATIVDYGERVAHYNFLTHRFAARSGSFGGPFNPYLVCGFPAVLVDSVPSLSKEEDRAGVLQSIAEGERPSTKVHWLGTIESLSHTYDQSGARTTAQLKYVRSHRTGDNTDDLLAESVTDQGIFKIQDADYSPAIGDGAVAWPVTSVKTMTAEHQKKLEDFKDAWIFQYVAKTVGGSLEKLSQSFLIKLYSGIPPEKDDVPPADQYRALGPNTADKSKEKVSVDASIKSPTGTEITEVSWSGAETWAVVRFKVALPEQGRKQFLSFKAGLTEITLMEMSRSSAYPFTKDVEEHKALAAFGEMSEIYDIGAIQSDPTGRFAPVQIDVPVLLPGDTLTIAYKGSSGSVAGSRDLPIEEAIRPPFIDKGVYTNAPSEEEGYSKIDLLYGHLFGSPSVIHNLLLAGATPYDGMDIHSVEQAVDYIVATASIQEGTQQSYVSALTSRNIASLPDILAPKGWKPKPASEGGYLWEYDAGTSAKDIKLTGGFHSNAVTGKSHIGLKGVSEISEVGQKLKFGSRLEFLDLETTRELGSRLMPEEKVTLGEDTSIRLDPRAPRAKRVTEYLQDIGGTSALRKLDFGSTGFTTTPDGRGGKG